jgi:protoporphyrinogen oxidase
VKLVGKLLGKNYLEHQRKAYIWIFGRWVPYPFQDNINCLAEEKTLECVLGLIEAEKGRRKPKNFDDWLLATFGSGIAKCFSFPYNKKVWAYPLEKMSRDWIGQRVNIVDTKKVLENIIYHRSSENWGPNKNFIYPLHGGTGGLFNQFTPLVKNNLYLGKEIVSVDIEEKKIRLKEGDEAKYDILINTMPLDKFIGIAKVRRLYREASNLKHNGVLIVGIGLEKESPSDKCWMYFPEDNCPFYRVTYLSNYSPFNVPGKGYYSLMCETSYSEFKKEDKKTIIERTIQGLINTKLIGERDRKKIVNKYLIDAPYAYPIPTLFRDKALRKIQPFLEKNQIFSRGRFGAWKYEVGNMDQSVMQGVEIIDRLLQGKTESII